MILPPILELSVVGVYDAGVPNRERIVLRPTEPVNLAQFGILTAYATPSALLPLHDNFFWLGDRVVAPPCYIIVYTGTGTNVDSSFEGTGEPVYVMHWGKANTIFNIPGYTLVPVVARLGAISIVPLLQSPSATSGHQNSAR